MTHDIASYSNRLDTIIGLYFDDENGTKLCKPIVMHNICDVDDALDNHGEYNIVCDDVCDDVCDADNIANNIVFDESSDETVTSPERKEINRDAQRERQKKYQESIMSCPLCEKQMKRSQYYYHLRKTHKVGAKNIHTLRALLKCQV
jgi:hypothetical protein